MKFDITPYRNYIEMDKPIPYVTRHKQVISLYPVKLKEANDFVNCYNVLTIDKNIFEDIEIIQSSYLQFLLQMVLGQDLFGKVEKHSMRYWQFVRIIELCFGLNKIEEQFKIKINEKGKFILEINDVIIDYKDFDNIIQIIQYQNIYDYEDERDLNPDYKKAVDEYYSLVNKNKEPITLERKISIVSAHNGMLKKDLLEMTFYSFTSLFNAVVEQIDYVVNKNFEANGGKFKKPIEHFAYKNKKGKYADAFVNKKNIGQGFKNV